MHRQHLRAPVAVQVGYELSVIDGHEVALDLVLLELPEHGAVAAVDSKEELERIFLVANLGKFDSILLSNIYPRSSSCDAISPAVLIKVILKKAIQ